MTKTIKEIKTKIDSVENYKLLSEEYVNAKSKLEILHESCGDVFQMNWDNFKQGRRCPGCSGRLKLTIEKIKPAIELGDEYELLSKEYIGSHSKLEILHYSCGDVFQMSWDNFNRGHRCPKCWFKKMGLDQTLSFETIKTEIDSVENYKLLSDEYINSRSKLEILHESCEDVFQMSWNSFQQGQRCPKCWIKNNRGENNPNWNSNLTDKERKHDRDLQRNKIIKWRESVLDRDDHTCQCCNVRGGLLEAHHIDSWKEHKDDRFNIDNGVTLCETCHKACHAYHKRLGYPLSTYKLFYEWMAKYSVIKPENWLWVIRYPDAMNKRLKFFKQVS